LKFWLLQAVAEVVTPGVIRVQVVAVVVKLKLRKQLSVQHLL
jgi:hypothetical protein